MSPSATSENAGSSSPAPNGPKAKQLGELDASKMIKTLVPESEQNPVPAVDDPVRLGQNCTTAHMVQVPWSMESGWGTPAMMPYGKIALEPTASVLHYATESFVCVTHIYQALKKISNRCLV